jgi:hypothetical protein
MSQMSREGQDVALLGEMGRRMVKKWEWQGQQGTGHGGSCHHKGPYSKHVEVIEQLEQGLMGSDLLLLVAQEEQISKLHSRCQQDLMETMVAEHGLHLWGWRQRDKLKVSKSTKVLGWICCLV